MVYSDFKTLSTVTTAFNLSIDSTQNLFKAIKPIKPSEYLKKILDEYLPLVNVINTEKARSELVIAPVLLEIRRIFQVKIGFFSGTDFTVDAEVGLKSYEACCR